jgi:hypothetical protein
MAKRRRLDVRRILADSDLRRELMVPTLQATQAREGIKTSREQAERAYYVVTEGERASFFDLEQYRARSGESDRRHEKFVAALRDDSHRYRFDLAHRDFSAVAGFPLAYRRIGVVAHIFRSAPSLEPSFGIAKQGLATSDDERWVRKHWEVPISRIGRERDWTPFAKGGDFSRFYSDISLVILWANDGKDLKDFVIEKWGSETKRIYSQDWYFRAGLTWPRRTAKGFNVRRMPPGCIFADKGPALFATSTSLESFLLGVTNTVVFEYLFTTKTAFSWEVGVLKTLPVVEPTTELESRIGRLAENIYKTKAAWDEGNEISTSFTQPWLLVKAITGDLSIKGRLDGLADFEVTREAEIQDRYEQLNDEVYKLYGISDSTRVIIEETLGKRAPETLWPQMEGKKVEQKRMEHIWRLLSYAVKRVIEADDDGIVPFAHISGESSLLERVRAELERLFPGLDSAQVETESVNQLKKSVKGYRRVNSLGEWLDKIYFDYHVSLYKSRPIFWHIASSQGTSTFAFGALVHYHKFDRNRIAKLRAQYLRETIDTCRREAALAEKDGRVDDRLEWQSRLEETQELDHRLQWVQEGHHEGPEGGDHDYRILTPWKTPDERPKGWDPDLDDGVKVNIEPLQKAGVLRIAKVV